jgi:hypothetical protein
MMKCKKILNKKNTKKIRVAVQVIEIEQTN